MHVHAHAQVCVPGVAGIERSPTSSNGNAAPPGSASTSSAPSMGVMVYGGFSGEAVEGDVMLIDSKVWMCGALCWHEHGRKAADVHQH